MLIASYTSDPVITDWPFRLNKVFYLLFIYLFIYLSGINYLVRSKAEDVELMNVPYNRTLETSKIESSKYLQREALKKLVDDQDVFLIQPTGS